MTHEYVIEMREITKKFGDFVANDKINLQLRKGETMHFLEKMVQEIYPDEYASWFIGTNKRRHRGKWKTVNLDSPSKKAASLGIEWCTNTLCWLKPSLLLKISSLVLKPLNMVFWTLKKASQDILDLSKKYGLAVDPNAKVEDISVGAQQRVEILKTLYRGADIPIFDEPTAVLTPAEIEELMTIMKN